MLPSAVLARAHRDCFHPKHSQPGLPKSYGEFPAVDCDENDPLKTSAIPRIDKGSEGIDAYFKRHSVFTKPIDRLPGEATLQDSGGKTRRFESDRDSGRKIGSRNSAALSSSA
jgi:hypothetical protein